MREVIGFIGTGRVGRALAVLFHRKGFTILSVVDKNLERARRCQKACGARVSSRDVTDTDPKTTVLFVTVPDDAIERVAEELASSTIPKPGMVIAHTSGLLSSDVLSRVGLKGVSMGSFHPCFSFVEDSDDDLDDVFVAIEGDAEGCRRLERLAEAIGGRPFILPKEDKPLYHAGCTMASSYFVTLMDRVQRVLSRMSRGEGIRTVLPLVRGTLRNIERVGIEQALTGPIQRGDVRTMESHLEVLTGLDPDLIPSYIDLGRATLRLAKGLGLEPDKIRSIEGVFKRFEGRGK